MPGGSVTRLDTDIANLGRQHGRNIVLAIGPKNQFSYSQVVAVVPLRAALQSYLSALAHFRFGVKAFTR